MKLLLAVALLGASVVACAGSASAQENYATPWCSITSGIGKECYQNLAQCQQNIQGNGGFCEPTGSFNAQQPSGYGDFPQQPNQ